MKGLRNDTAVKRIIFVNNRRQECIGIAVYILAFIGARPVPSIEIADLGGSQYHVIRIADPGNPEFRALHFLRGAGNHSRGEFNPALLRLGRTQ